MEHKNGEALSTAGYPAKQIFHAFYASFSHIAETIELPLVRFRKGSPPAPIRSMRIPCRPEINIDKFGGEDK